MGRCLFAKMRLCPGRTLAVVKVCVFAHLAIRFFQCFYVMFLLLMFVLFSAGYHPKGPTGIVTCVNCHLRAMSISTFELCY